MEVTRITNAIGPTVVADVVSKRGVARSYTLQVGTTDDQGDFVGRPITATDGRIRLYPSGTPDAPGGTPSYEFSTTGTGMVKDDGTSTYTISWNEAESLTLASGRYPFRFELIEAAEVVDRPLQGYWYHQ